MELCVLAYRIKDKYLYLKLPMHTGEVNVKTINNNNDMVIIEIYDCHLINNFIYRKE